MKLGSADITGIKLGSTDITKLMLGSTEVWSAGPDVTFSRDFGDQPLSTDPATPVPDGWARFHAGATDFEIHIIEDGAAVGGRFMRLRPMSGTVRYAAWSGIPASADMEALVQFRQTTGPNGSNQGPSIFVRASPDSQSYLGFRPVTTNGGSLQLYYGIPADNFENVGTTTATINQADEVWWVRMQVIGSALKVKMWKPADPLDPEPDEPAAWGLEANLPGAEDTGPGYVGLGAFQSAGNIDWGYVGVSTDPATVSAPYPSGDTDALVSLLITQDELTVLRDTDRKFRAAGDFATNSPGIWDAMVSGSQLTFSDGRWSGPTTLNPDGSLVASSSTSNDPSADAKNMAVNMYGAAIVALVNDDSALAASIVAEIDAQRQETNLDFTNRTRYPLDHFHDLNPLFMMAIWMRYLLLAYDICKAMGHTSANAEQWFLDFALLCADSIDNDLSTPFPDRASDDYTTRIAGVDANADRPWAYTSDSTLLYGQQYPRYYNNRRNDMAAFAGLVGVAFNNTTYTNAYKRYMREWMMFSTRVSDGIMGDFERSTESFPQLSLSYDLLSLFGLMAAADALARRGDTSVYDYSSSDGTGGTGGTAEGLRTMEDVINTRYRWVAETFADTYAPPDIGNVNVEANRLKPVNGATGNMIPFDSALLMPARYYGRSDWRDAVNRVGTPSGWTTTIHNAGNITGIKGASFVRFLDVPEIDPY